MNTVQIKIVAAYREKGGAWFHSGEKYTARRLTLGILDIKTPFQIVDGTRSGSEIPYKNAIVLKGDEMYSKEQYERILEQRDEALAQRDTALSNLAKHGQTIVELQNDKLSLLDTIERTVTHNEIQPLPREVVQALESFKRNGHILDTVLRWIISPFQCEDVWREEINTLRRYSIEDGWKLISGMVNGYVVEPQLAEPEGIAETVLQWWGDRCIDANTDDLDNLVDRLKSHIAERHTTVQ